MYIFFDLDGTLSDPKEGITRCLEYAVTSVGGVVPDRYRLTRYIGPPLREALRELLPYADADTLEEAIGLYRERFSSRGMYENTLYPDIRRVLDGLADDGFSMSVLTSKPCFFARQIVDYFAISGLFDQVYGPELSDEHVSKTRLLGDILTERKIYPEDALFVGDRFFDVEAAHENGLYAVGVLWGFGSKAELERAGADELIANPGDLRSVIRRLVRAV